MASKLENLREVVKKLLAARLDLLGYLVSFRVAQVKILKEQVTVENVLLRSD
jgi:hypothetical protein